MVEKTQKDCRQTVNFSSVLTVILHSSFRQSRERKVFLKVFEVKISVRDQSIPVDRKLHPELPFHPVFILEYHNKLPLSLRRFRSFFIPPYGETVISGYDYINLEKHFPFLLQKVSFQAITETYCNILKIQSDFSLFSTFFQYFLPIRLIFQKISFSLRVFKVKKSTLDETSKM